MGRLPIDAVPRLRRLKASNTPAVVGAVYGNRAYEGTLLKPRDLVSEIGFKPVAGGAFIGEHSHSAEESPLAHGRPDAKDLKKAMGFGKKIHEQILKMNRLEGQPPLQVPGHYPYKERRPRAEAGSPNTKEELCITCGKCAEVCPTAAITVGRSVTTKQNACSLCCACVKNCPTNARVVGHPQIKEAAKRRSMNYRERKEPEMYIPSYLSQLSP